MQSLEKAPRRLTVRAADADSVEYTLWFDDAGTRTGTLSLADVAVGDRERVLALALAEAAREAPTPPEVAAPAVLAPPVIEAPITTAAPAAIPLRANAHPPLAETSARWRPGAVAEMGGRVFSATGALALDPLLGAWLRHRSGARFDLGARMLWSEQDTALGNTTLTAILGSARVSYDWALSSRAAIRIGPRVDVGAAFGSGHSRGKAIELRTQHAALTMLVADVEFRVRVARHAALALGLDAGGVLNGMELRADEQVGVVVRGATTGVHLGVSTF